MSVVHQAERGLFTNLAYVRSAPADWDEPSEPGKVVQRGGVADEKGAAPLGGPAGQH